MPENDPPKLRVGSVLCRPCWATPALLGTQRAGFLEGEAIETPPPIGRYASGDPSSSDQKSPAMRGAGFGGST